MQHCRMLFLSFTATLIGSTAVAQSHSPRDTLVAAGPQYRASGLHELMLGREYRSLWTTPITVPVLDLGSFAGGLRPVSKGGGFQTKSLLLAGADGREFLLPVDRQGPLSHIAARAPAHGGRKRGPRPDQLRLSHRSTRGGSAAPGRQDSARAGPPVRAAEGSAAGSVRGPVCRAHGVPGGSDWRFERSGSKVGRRHRDHRQRQSVCPHRQQPG